MFRSLLKRPVIVSLAVCLGYLAFGYWAAPPLVKWAAERYVANELQHRLSMDEPEIDPLRLSVRLRSLALADPEGAPLLGFKELFVDFEGRSLFRWAYVLDAVQLDGPTVNLELRPDGTLNFTRLIEALNKDKEEDTGPPRLRIEHFQVSGGRFDFADRKVSPAFTTRLEPLSLRLTDLSTLPEDKGDYQLAADSVFGARLRWKGDIRLKPLAVNGAFSLEGLQLARLMPYLQSRLAIAPPGGSLSLQTQYRVAYDDKHLALGLSGLGLKLAGVELRGSKDKTPALNLSSAEIRNAGFDLDRRRVDLGEIRIQGGQVRLARDAAGRFSLQDWLVPSEPAQTPVEGSVATAGEAARPWQIALKRFDLDGVKLAYADAGFSKPLAVEVANLRAGCTAQAEVGAATPQVKVEQAGVDLSGVRLASVGGDPFLVLGGVGLEGGRFDLAGQRVEAERFSLLNGQVTLRRDARGVIPLLQAFKPVQRDRPAPVADDRTGTPWQFHLAMAELGGFQAIFRDDSVKPAARLTVEQLQLSLENVSEDMKVALPVKLAFRVAEGGSFEAEGRLVPVPASLDARLKLSGLALKPAQPYLSEAANLTLVSGRASTSGRLRYQNGLRYEGQFAVQKLLLNETGTANRFLSWETLSSNDMRLTGNGLAMDELRLDGLGAKLVIYTDKTVNLKKILKPPEPSFGPATRPPAPVATEPEAKPRPAFNVDIERVRVSRGELDFADLSLALPFATRIHGFTGAVNGISSRPGGVAQLELDGRVDDYGMARVTGQVDLFDPTGFMDIKTLFRNVEMTRLTPYTATFAGRRIASGKLSLDLEYKIKQRQLQGENQVIMDQLTLGERVESPTAKNLPLDLALAILKDSDGRIDLGLPVSGSLDDPQFSYGQIVWKAIVNVITKVVTAPFRALGKLLGISGEQLEQIAFDAGEDALLPPQREALKQLTQAMAKRPALLLVVRGTWDPEVDRVALQDLQLRRALAVRQGIALAEGEDPGPASTAQPKTRKALETLYAERFGRDALSSLESKHRQANPDGQGQGAGQLISRLSGLLRKDVPVTQEELQALKGADLHGVLYGRLREREVIPDSRLLALANARGQAIAGEMKQNGLPAERVRVEAPESTRSEGRTVAVKLSVAAGQNVAPPAPMAKP